MQKGNLFVISGPSGAGKGTLVARLIERIPNTWLSISATTREPRPGEIPGIHYFFMTDSEFKTLADAHGFLEWARVHDHYYGTPRSHIEEHIANGDQVILEIDVQGALQVRRAMPVCHLIFVEPPSLVELESRLRGRATEPEDVILSRLTTAEVELSHKMEYDYQVVNDDLDQATQDLVDIITRYANTKEEVR